MMIPLTEDDVLAGVSYDEALTTQEVADRVLAPALRWPMRGTIRNRLYALADRGLVICDEERPMRWLRPDLVLTAGVPLYFPPDPFCYGCGGSGAHAGRPCPCRTHEHGPDGCDDICTPECKRRAELRGEA